MNKLTKTIGITLLAGLMALSLAACGGDKPAADTSSPAASAPASSEAAASDAVSSFRRKQLLSSSLIPPLRIIMKR